MSVTTKNQMSVTTSWALPPNTGEKTGGVFPLCLLSVTATWASLPNHRVSEEITALPLPKKHTERKQGAYFPSASWASPPLGRHRQITEVKQRRYTAPASSVTKNQMSATTIWADEKSDERNRQTSARK
jgi:hypothetical protein